MLCTLSSLRIFFEVSSVTCTRIQGGATSTTHKHIGHARNHLLGNIELEATNACCKRLVRRSYAHAPRLVNMPPSGDPLVRSWCFSCATFWFSLSIERKNVFIVPRILFAAVHKRDAHRNKKKALTTICECWVHISYNSQRVCVGSHVCCFLTSQCWLRSWHWWDARCIWQMKDMWISQVHVLNISAAFHGSPFIFGFHVFALYILAVWHHMG